MVMKKVLVLCVVLVMKNLCAFTMLSQQFKKIRESTYFVDKTLLIKEFLNYERPLVIASPHGFGKSSNLHMMETFLTMNKTHRAIIFNNTNISLDKEFMKNELGNHAVIYCSFQPDRPIVDYSSIIAAFRSIMYRTFAMHPYLTRSKKVSRDQKRGLTFYTGVKKHLKLQHYHILTGLYFLSKLLRQHHEKKVVLMIDDYDRIILDSIFLNELSYKDVIGLHNAIFSSVLHKNNNICKIILVGNTCTCIKPLAQLQHLHCFNFIHLERFAPYFGITDQELDKLIVKTKSENFRYRKEDIKKWYGGYISSSLNSHIYNTKSTLSFLRSGNLKSYWSDNRATKTLKYLLIEPYVQELFDDAVLYQEREIHINDTVEISHIQALKSFSMDELWDEEYGDLFLHLLMELGYFTLAEKWISHTKEKSMKIKVPNEEVCHVFRHINTTFRTDSIEFLDRVKETIHDICFSNDAHPNETELLTPTEEVIIDRTLNETALISSDKELHANIELVNKLNLY